MSRYITAVDYDRHPLTTAYIQVTGCTAIQALHRAKKLGAELLERLPSEANLLPPRKSSTPPSEGYGYEVRVIIALCPEEARAIISEIVLKGSV